MHTRQLLLLYPGGEKSGGRVLVRGGKDVNGPRITRRLLDMCRWWMGASESDQSLTQRMLRKLRIRPDEPPELPGEWEQTPKDWRLVFHTESDLRKAVRTLQFAHGVWMPLQSSGITFKDVSRSFPLH